MGFRVYGLGILGILGLGFRVQGLEFTIFCV